MNARIKRLFKYKAWDACDSVQVARMRLVGGRRGALELLLLPVDAFLCFTVSLLPLAQALLVYLPSVSFPVASPVSSCV